MTRAPFPWFGGKSRAAGEVWAALGDVPNYVEPFAGSLGAMLGRPDDHARKIETVNDADGLLVNWWRAVRAAPEEVAGWADWPVSEIDLTARHLWLVGERDAIKARLIADPEWYDAKAAGWWVWGACCWIGSGWCSGTGPWRLVEGEVVKGNAGRGIHRQLPHLGDAGRGIHRQLPHLGNAGRGSAIAAWFADLSVRLERTRVTCGDWRRVVTPSVTHRHGTTGVLLDPPYPEGWSTDAAYSGQTESAAKTCADVFAWAEEAGQREDMRVIVCGYSGTWAPPAGWTERPWTARKGYARNANHRREVLWCSPACLPAAANNPAGLVLRAPEEAA